MTALVQEFLPAMLERGDGSNLSAPAEAAAHFSFT
jgi:hypothetical protein